MTIFFSTNNISDISDKYQVWPKTAHLDEDPPATDAYEGLAGTLAGNVDATPALRRKMEKGGRK